MTFKHYTSLLLISVLFFFNALPAQYEVAAYDFAQNYFNNGQALPAESNLLLTGEAPMRVSRIEVSVFKANANHSRPPLYQAVWLRPEGQQDNGYTLPLNFKLHGNSDYDILFAYFRPVSDQQREDLRKLLAGTTARMMNQAVFVQEGKLVYQGNENRLQRDMEDFVTRALATYRSSEANFFQGFSTATERALKALFDIAEVKDIESSLKAAREQVAAEIDQLLLEVRSVRSDQRTVRDYPTEKVAGSLAVNVGYGGVYLDGKVEDLTYGEGPYVGLSLPLGSRTFSGRFLSNTSISVGAFLNNFENKQGETLTGPIFSRPYFVGLGYSLFRFVRLNAGAVALEQRTVSGNGFDTGAVQIKPFVGISAELNLSISLGQKR
ncbi:MAG: hypothetical protein R3B47_08310 [Bacteroidia bacterium]